MQPNFEKVPIYHYPLPEGSPRVVTGFYFRRIERQTVPDIDLSILDSPMVPEPDDKGSGGTQVPLDPSPKVPPPDNGTAKRLPAILRA